MRCPYRMNTIHKPEHTIGYAKKFAEDVNEFGECYKEDCPFYYTTEYKPARQITEHCRKAESEGEHG